MDVPPESEIDILLRTLGVSVTKNNFEIDDKIPIVQNRKAILYIREPQNFHIYQTLPKYHILHCRKLREMQKQGDYRKYYATHRADGMFPLKLSNNNPVTICKLTLCAYCFRELRELYGWHVFPTDPEKFPLEDWLEPPFDYASEEWKKRSLDCRKKANWTCQECNINLESNPHLLQAHHKWGTKFNDPQDLIALCIRCHAKQPGGGHRGLKRYPEYNEFMSYYINRKKT